MEIVMFCPDDVERGSGIYRADAKLIECINMKERTYFQQHHLMSLYLFIFNQREVHLERGYALSVHSGGRPTDFSKEKARLFPSPRKWQHSEGLSDNCSVNRHQAGAKTSEWMRNLNRNRRCHLLPQGERQDKLEAMALPLPSRLYGEGAERGCTLSHRSSLCSHVTRWDYPGL